MNASQALPFRTAVEAGVKELFHYQKSYPDYVADVLLNDRIKYSDARTFNDPWDRRPHFSRALLDDPDVYERHVKHVVDIQRRIPGVPEKELARLVQILRTDRAFMEARIDECTQAMCDAIQDEYRVYCLSSLPDSFLMWAHYTDGHKGVCFGFRTESDRFCGALEVRYSKTYPEIDLSREDELGFLHDGQLTKGEQWAYEREFRLLAKEGGRQKVLSVRDGFAPFEPRDLSKVIAGCLMREADLRALREIIGRRKIPVPLYQMQPGRDRYELVIQELR